MSSRAKKKRQKAGLPEPGEEEKAAAAKAKADKAAYDNWPGEHSPELSPRQERWLKVFFGAFPLFILGGGGSFWLFESGIVALGFALLGAVIGVVLVRRGVDLFE